MNDRLTHQKWSDNIDLKQEYGYSLIYKRLYEIEDKIENGELVFVDEPFYSEERECWGVYQKIGDVVRTLFMTEEQANAYKKRKEQQINEMAKIIMRAIDETIQDKQAPANATEARLEAEALYNAGYRKN